MSITPTTDTTATPARASTTLESGDRMPRAEFHRRYCARPDLKKAELVEGVVYVPSPARFRPHAVQHGAAVSWLGTFAAHAPGVELAVEATVYLGGLTEVQPDALLVRLEPAVGRIHLNADGYLEGTPDLVVEIAASSLSYDLHDKKAAFERAGVPEHVVWRVEDRAVDWFRLVEGRYVRVEPDERGVIESTSFPGLRLHVPKLLAGDLAGVLAELEHPGT